MLMTALMMDKRNESGVAEKAVSKVRAKGRARGPNLPSPTVNYRLTTFPNNALT